MAVETEHTMPDTLDELRTLEREIEREWWWLHGALAQARELGRRRVQVAVRIAEMDAQCGQ